MRNAFAEEIGKLALADPRIVLLSGDIGNRIFDDFKQSYPGRFYNCGVAEANMTGMAAGLALCGLRPVTYTIASFNTTRCLEQIRLDLCYHGLPVVIVGTGAGLAYADNGPTHTTSEDIACIRVIPGMAVVCPADCRELRLALRAALAHDGPVYLRIGKKGEPDVHPVDPEFSIGRAIVVRPGKRVCLIGSGSIVHSVLAAADILSGSGIDAQVVSMHTVKPLDTELLTKVTSGFTHLVTVEEHGIAGGLGGAVAEWMADNPSPPTRLVRLGLPDRFLDVASNHRHAREMYGLTPEAIAVKIRGLL